MQADRERKRRGAARGGDSAASAVLVIRAWRGGDESQFRARITRTTNIEEEAESTSVVATRAEIEKVVNAWIDKITPP